MRWKKKKRLEIEKRRLPHLEVKKTDDLVALEYKNSKLDKAKQVVNTDAMWKSFGLIPEQILEKMNEN